MHKQLAALREERDNLRATLDALNAAGTGGGEEMKHHNGGNGSQPAHGEQTNRISGDNNMASFFHRPLPHPLQTVPLPHGSPNQKVEAAVVGYGNGVPGARAVLLNIHAGFKASGFQRMANANEFMTNSHGPHWDRCLFMWLYFAVKLGDAETVAVALEMIGWRCYVLDAVEVSSGPLAHRRVALGGRYRVGGWDSTVDADQQQIKGEALTEPHVLVSGNVAQDTFPAVVVHWLLGNGALKSIPRNPPPVACDYTVERYEDGHVCRAPVGGLETAPAWLAVRYSTGEVTTSNDPAMAVPDGFGAQAGGIQLEAVA